MPNPKPSALVVALMIPFCMYAQTPAPQHQKLAFLISDLIDDSLQGLDLGLRDILQPAINPSFAAVNTGVAAELSNLPIPSPASAVRYVFDRQLGIRVPTPQSQGPILTERGETIGKDRLFFAVTYQRFQFDRQDRVDFRAARVSIPLKVGEASLGLLNSEFTLSLSIDQVIAQMTYGVTPWLDVSYAQPLVVSRLGADVHASVAILGGQPQPFPRITGLVSSTGLGDGVGRVKARLFQHAGLTVGAAVDVRLPIGDELNYHGAGAYGLKPFLIASLTKRFVSPHVNLGYQVNGKSFLASRSAREQVRLPAQAFVSVGVEGALSPRATVAFDILDQLIFHAQRTFFNTITEGGATYNTLAFPNQSRHEANASIGMKARVAGDLALTGNLLIRLNEAGLRARVVPLLGVSYIF